MQSNRRYPEEISLLLVSVILTYHVSQKLNFNVQSIGKVSGSAMRVELKKIPILSTLLAVALDTPSLRSALGLTARLYRQSVRFIIHGACVILSILRSKMYRSMTMRGVDISRTIYVLSRTYFF